MTTYKELGELMRNLPTDETWLPLFLGRLKEKDPEIYRRMMELANNKLKEKTDEG
jgi:TorA maturation chaperone TorD